MDGADREPLGLGHEVALRAPRSTEAAVAHTDRSTQNSGSSSHCCPHRHADRSARSTTCRGANGYAYSVTHGQADGCADGPANSLTDGSARRTSDGVTHGHPEAGNTDTNADARPAASDRPAVGRV